MKKTALALAGLLCALTLSAQEIRTNYRSGGMTHISTDYELVKAASVPFWTRVELVGFPDGSTLYLLYMNFEQRTATNVPKGVKMAATLPGGKIVRVEQIGTDSATKKRLRNGLFWNRTKYAVETADMEKMVRGVKSLDVVTGWNPDDYIQLSFPGDEFAALLKRHCAAIKEAASATVDLKAEPAGHTDNVNSTMTASKPVVAHGKRFIYNVILTHLYYKDTNMEDIDLTFQVGTSDTYHIPYDAPVTFTLADGSTLTLPQTRDEDNFVYLTPSLEQVRALAAGVKSVTVTCDGGTLTDTFPDGADGFAQAVNQQYQLLMSLSAR